MELPILYFKGTQIKMSTKESLLYLKFGFKQCILQCLHFIRVFTVCQSRLHRYSESKGLNNTNTRGVILFFPVRVYILPTDSTGCILTQISHMERERGSK